MVKNEQAALRIVEKHLGSLETQVMRAFWNGGEMSVRDVRPMLSGRKSRAYTTVMTVAHRLWGKGLLDRRLIGRAYAYRARINEQEFVAQVTRQSVRSLIADFGGAAVAHFVGELQEADPAEFARLRELLSEGEP